MFAAVKVRVPVPVLVSDPVAPPWEITPANVVLRLLLPTVRIAPVAMTSELVALVLEIDPIATPRPAVDPDPFAL